MKRLLGILLALTVASGADGRALFIRGNAVTSSNATGIERIAEVVQATSSTLGGSYDVTDINSFPDGSTGTLRRGAWYRNGVSSTGDSTVYGLIVILGDDMGATTGTVANTISAISSGGFAWLLTSTAQGFQALKPGMLVSGTQITGRAVIVGIDSLGQRMRVKGTVDGGPVGSLRWFTPVATDSLTLSPFYPKVPILRFGQYVGTAGAFLTANGRCSTGVGNLITYSSKTWQDSTLSVYEVGKTYRTWKSRAGVAALASRDVRGWRPILGTRTTRQDNPGYAGGNYDFPDPACGNPQADFNNPDTLALWEVQNRDIVNGARLGGVAASNIYCVPAHLNGSNFIDPGTILTALALGDSLSGGALFGTTGPTPAQMAFHIDDGFKRSDSKLNTAGAYGGIGWNDTTAFKATIDSLAALAVPFTVGVELDSVSSVLLSNQISVTQCSYTGSTVVTLGDFIASGVTVGMYVAGAGVPAGTVVVSIEGQLSLTVSQAVFGGPGATLVFHSPGDGNLYDKRWWARAPLAHYTPHCHSGLSGTQNMTRAQNILSAADASPYLRPLDLFGIARTRYAFGSLDSSLAYGLTDFRKEAPDSGATYYLLKRAFFLCDSIFGKDKTDHLIMPPADDWTNGQVTRANGVAVDSILAAFACAGASGVRANMNINVIGNLSANIYGYYPNYKRTTVGLLAVHAQPVTVVTLTVPVSALPPWLPLVGESVKVQGGPAWFTVKFTVLLGPVTVTTPERARAVALASTE